MANKICFEAVNRTLRTILRFLNSGSMDKLFGSKTVVLGDDFRQILLVVPKGRKEQIINASIN